MGKYRNEHYKSVNSNKGKDYDFVIEKTIRKFNLDYKSRKSYLKDQVHYLLMWWKQNASRTKKFKTLRSIGEALNSDHSNIIHYVGKINEDGYGTRIKSTNFVNNVMDISEFIKDCSCAKMLKLDHTIKYNFYGKSRKM
jgi:hypothetical protein